MTDHQQERLIDHLDNSMQGKTAPETDQLIAADPEMAQAWQDLHTAVDAVRNAALHDQVMAMRKVWMDRQNDAAKSSKTPVVSIYRNVLRVAACVILLAGGAAVYKYATTSPAGLYHTYYTSFDLTTMRGAGAMDPMDEAYKEKNWAGVIAIHHAAKSQTNKSAFLTGMAYLELKNYSAAIAQFRQVLAENQRSGNNYFQDEAEYYLAMGLLAQREVNQALVLLEKIKADPEHLYHDKVAGMSFTDLRIAAFKNPK